MINRAGSRIQRAMALFCALLFPVSITFAQQLAGPPPVSIAAQQAAPLLSPDQLNNLVAPVALYPDPLLGEVLAASTYPVEIVEAQQWLQKNPSLTGAQLMDAAKQQNWDPSVQALVAFPDALKLLGNDIRWTTDLGNAFLAQQPDVMSAVQGMRARAEANGRLANTPQQVVTTDTQDNQSAIEIQPADPEVIYVPVYDPAYVWGPQPGALTRICGTPTDSDLGSDQASTSAAFSQDGEVGAAGVGAVDGLVTACSSIPDSSTDTDSGAALAVVLQAVASEDAVHGPTIRAIEWAFHTPTVPWRAGSIRPDLMAAEPTVVNSAALTGAIPARTGAIPARQLEAALMPRRAQADGAHSMATIGRQQAMPGSHPQT